MAHPTKILGGPWPTRPMLQRPHAYICLFDFECLSVSPLTLVENHTAELHQFLVHVVYDSVLLWRRCNLLCTSGFVDDVMFS